MAHTFEGALFAPTYCHICREEHSLTVCCCSRPSVLSIRDQAGLGFLELSLACPDQRCYQEACSVRVSSQQPLQLEVPSARTFDACLEAWCKFA